MLEVKIVYVDPNDPERGTDFVTRVAPLEADLNALEALPKEGVLFIVISTEWGNRAAMVDRLWGNYSEQWYGEDSYVIGTMSGTVKSYPDPVDLFFTEAYPDARNRLECRAINDPHQASRLDVEKPPRYPPEAQYVTFRGAWMDSDVWHDVAVPMFEELY